MANLKYPMLADKQKLKELLKTMTRRQLSLKYGIPYGCITNRLKDWTSEELAGINIGRLHWTTEEKIKLVLRAERLGYTAVAEEMGINRTHLSHWKIFLVKQGLLIVEPKQEPVVSDRVLNRRRARRKRREG